MAPRHASIVFKNTVHDLLVLEGAGHGFRGDQRTEASNARIAWFDKHLAECRNGPRRNALACTHSCS